jgi:hypothetical protein
MVGVVRILTALMALYFLCAVGVQYNDPDPLRWMAIYGAAALACVLALVRRLRRWVPVGVALVAAAWAATLAPGSWHVAPRPLRQAGMLTPVERHERCSASSSW